MANEAAVAQAQTQLANAEKQLGYSSIRAPFSGVVSEKSVAAGDVVQPGAAAKVLATNDLKDTILATPSIANGSIYLRSDKFLYRIVQSKKSS